MLFNDTLNIALDNVFAEDLLAEEADSVLLATLNSTKIPDEQKAQILSAVKSTIDPSVASYAKYVMLQVARGYLAHLEEDMPMLNKTMVAFFKASKKGTWTQSKNLYDYKNWHDLASKVVDFGAMNSDYSEVAKAVDSNVLLTKTYPETSNPAVGFVEGATYWLRQILTGAGAVKYGKGTQWCTSSTSVELSDEKHMANQYLKKGLLYTIERKLDDGQREPLLQFWVSTSGEKNVFGYDHGPQWTGVQNNNITRVSNRLANFLNDIIENVKLPESVIKSVSEICIASVAGSEVNSSSEGPDPKVYAPFIALLGVVSGPAITGKSFCWTGTRKGISEVEVAGGIVKSGISKGLDYLVVKDVASASSKAKKAAAYGIKVITLDQLGMMLAGATSSTTAV